MKNTPTNGGAKLLCEKLQFLIGVPSRYIGTYDNYRGMLVEVRQLCKLRSTIVDKFQDINQAFYAGVCLADIPEIARNIEMNSRSRVCLRF